MSFHSTILCSLNLQLSILYEAAGKCIFKPLPHQSFPLHRRGTEIAWGAKFRPDSHQFPVTNFCPLLPPLLFFTSFSQTRHTREKRGFKILILFASRQRATVGKGSKIDPTYVNFLNIYSAWIATHFAGNNRACCETQFRLSVLLDRERSSLLPSLPSA